MGWFVLPGKWAGNRVSGPGIVFRDTMEWQLRRTPTSGDPDAGRFLYGGAKCIPVVGDWSGDGKDGIGVVYLDTMEWWIRNTATPGDPDAGRFRYGDPQAFPPGISWYCVTITNFGNFYKRFPVAARSTVEAAQNPAVLAKVKRLIDTGGSPGVSVSSGFCEVGSLISHATREALNSSSDLSAVNLMP